MNQYHGIACTFGKRRKYFGSNTAPTPKTRTTTTKTKPIKQTKPKQQNKKILLSLQPLSPGNFILFSCMFSYWCLFIRVNTVISREWHNIELEIIEALKHCILRIVYSLKFILFESSTSYSSYF